MSIEGQGHFFTIYLPGFVLYSAKISGERLQDHWSSGYVQNIVNIRIALSMIGEESICSHLRFRRFSIFSVSAKTEGSDETVGCKVFECYHFLGS